MALPIKLPVLTYFTGDTAPIIQCTILKTDGSAFVIPGGTTVKCKIRLMGATANLFSGANENASIVDANTGRVNYTLPSAWTDPGVYYTQVEMTMPTGVQSTQRAQINVEEGL